MPKSFTVPIVYTPGAYGSFLNWSIKYFSGSTSDLPFDHSTGSSHNWSKFKHIKSTEHYIQYVTDTTTDKADFCLIHPVQEKNDNIIEHIEKIAKFSEKLIFINVEEDCFLHVMNNNDEKVYGGDGALLTDNLATTADNIKKGWDKTLSEMDRWEKREFISLYAFGMQAEIIQTYRTKNYTNTKILMLNVRDIIFNYAETIKNVLNYCGLVEARSNYEEVHTKWFSLQKHIHKDLLCKRIISSIVNNIIFDWDNQNITIVDEAYIQQQLRDNHQIGIKCFNLNNFPTNTENLKPLLEKLTT